MESHVFVNGSTKMDMFCALGDISLLYASFVIVIHLNKCYRRGYVHITMLIV